MKYGECGFGSAHLQYYVHNGFQIGSSRIKFLMFLLAVYRDVLALIESGTVFQILAESF